MANPCFDTANNNSSPDLCQRLCTPIPDTYYDNGSHYNAIFSMEQGVSVAHPVATASGDENYWASTFSSNSSGASPNNSTGYYSPTMSTYHHHHRKDLEQHPVGASGAAYYAPQYEKLGPSYETYYTHSGTATDDVNVVIPVVRVVKRRNTANKKERRRTQSINSAFTYLRDRIPNVPADTKLSKIKTLRLATSYINYLTRVLEGEDTPGGFRAELVPSSRKINAERRANMKNNGLCDNLQLMLTTHKGSIVDGRKKGRTGWPQEVWRNALKSEPQG